MCKRALFFQVFLLAAVGYTSAGTGVNVDADHDANGSAAGQLHANSETWNTITAKRQLVSGKGKGKGKGKVS